jgi:thioredoxin-dependent peroxiredoxin
MDDDLIPGLPSVGSPAPELALPDDSGTIQDLAAQRGRWVVLFFYPKDFTSGCTTEACEFRDLTGVFRAAGAVVWGISVLDSASKAGFKAEHSLDYPLLADEDHAVAERYGVWVEKTNHGKRYHGIQRSTFLVDPEGRIAHVWPRVTVEGHAAEVLETLRATSAAR